MAYGVVRSDNLKATKNGNIRSAKFMVGTTPTVIENGNLVKVDELIGTANRELFKAVAPGATTDINIGVVASPELIFDETKHYSLADFRNEADQPITVLMLEKGDLLSVSDECIIAIDDTDDIPAVGNLVTLTVDGTKWTEIATLDETTPETFYGKIIARELYKKDTYLNVIQILATN